MPVGTIGTDRSAGLMGGRSGPSKASGVMGAALRTSQGPLSSPQAKAAYDASRAKAAGTVSSSADPLHQNVAAYVRDLNDEDNSALDTIGNAIASLFGFNERTNPAFGGVYGQPEWGFDPTGMIGTGLGTALGVPFLGTAFNQIAKLMGNPLEIGLGAPSPYGNMQTAMNTGGQIANGPGGWRDALRNPSGSPTGPGAPAAAGLPQAFAALPQTATAPLTGGMMLPGFSRDTRFGRGTIQPYGMFG